MSRPKLPANHWSRAALIGTAVMLVGGIAVGGCGDATPTPTVPAGTVSTLTTDPPTSYTTDDLATLTTDTTVAAPPTTAAPVPVTTETPVRPTEVAVPQQGSGGSGSGSGSGSGGSDGSGSSCGSDSYVNSDGQCVHDPVQAPSAPSGATARCEDGTYSFSKHHSGTCSGHGGVAEWL